MFMSTCVLGLGTCHKHYEDFIHDFPENSKNVETDIWQILLLLLPRDNKQSLCKRSLRSFSCEHQKCSCTYVLPSKCSHEIEYCSIWMIWCSRIHQFQISFRQLIQTRALTDKFRNKSHF